MALNLKYQTEAQFAARLRERYRNASREEAAHIATWILNKINAGDLTDAQMRSAFGLTLVQYNALKTRMNSLRTAYQTVQASVGE